MSGEGRRSTAQLLADLQAALAAVTKAKDAPVRLLKGVEAAALLELLAARVLSTLEAPVPIGEAWASYSAALLDPIGAGAAQREETKRAFYAGAAAMFSAVLEGADLEEDAAAARLESLDRELADYMRLFKSREGIAS